MWLERFNQYGRLLDFDVHSASWAEKNSADARATIVGVGDVLSGRVVALVCVGRDLYLYIGRAEFSLHDPALKLTYEHMDDGTTAFSAADSNRSARIAYDSWWRNSGVGIASFGSPSDEDEDICAYVQVVMNDSIRRAHVMAKYG